jgi:hypothetical protein
MRLLPRELISLPHPKFANVDFITFSDEIESIPFEQLAYSSERGLYDKRFF